MSHPPRARQDVTLVAPQRGSVQARVRAVGDRWVDVQLLESMRERLTSKTVYLHYLGDDGLLRLTGQLDGTTARAHGDVLRIAHRGSAMLLQRIAPVPCEAELVAQLSAGGPRIECLAVAVSAGGVQLTGLQDPVEGADYLFELLLPDEHGVPVLGRMTFEAPGERAVGFRFTQIEPDMHQRIVAWCAANNRTAA